MGATINVRLSNDVIERARTAKKTVTTYLANRLADHLRAEGLLLVLPWRWFVIETMSDDLDGMHIHGGAASPGALVMPKELKLALGRALRRLGGEFGGPAGRFAVRTEPYDPRKGYAGRYGAAGWAAYAMKDCATKAGLARAKRRLGCSPVYVAQPLRRHIRDMYEAYAERPLPAGSHGTAPPGGLVD